jgi:hypothetical protein
MVAPDRTRLIGRLLLFPLVHPASVASDHR